MTSELRESSLPPGLSSAREREGVWSSPGGFSPFMGLKALKVDLIGDGIGRDELSSLAGPCFSSVVWRWMSVLVLVLPGLLNWVGLGVNSCGADWGGLWAERVLGSPWGYDDLLGSLLPGNSRLWLMWSALCHQLNFGWVRVFVCIMSVFAYVCWGTGISTSFSPNEQENYSLCIYLTDQHVRTQYKYCIYTYEFVRLLSRMNNAPERVSIVGKSVNWGVKEEQERQSAPSQRR